MKNIISIPIWLRLLALSLILSSPAALAEIIENRLASGNVLSADFHAGKPQLPAIILLHGFLQTRDFPTVSRLAEGLSAAGYTTLTPTLSLGISRRTKSLPCEAAHRHTLDQDIAEIASWVDWLAKRQPGPIVFIGHSYGSLQGLVYASNTPNPALRHIIAISLVDTERHSTNVSVASMLAQAKARSVKNDTRLVDFAIGHCKRFNATPASYLSYANWDRQRVLSLSRNSRVPMHVILGGEDTRMGKGWSEALSAAGVHVDRVNGANHFFDAEYEFDLLDLVLGLLKTPKT